VLNNRASGFTGPPNTAGPGRRPVHTLAPVLLEQDGRSTALATPGADGQVQTLLQVLCRLRSGADLGAAVAAPRWRSESSRLLVEASHPAREALAARGHELSVLEDGDERFGAVVSASCGPDGPSAVGDWRREVAAGGAACARTGSPASWSPPTRPCRACWPRWTAAAPVRTWCSTCTWTPWSRAT
jgi:gamma-glutamyltranspeptidase/glutathione hydrolase